MTTYEAGIKNRFLDNKVQVNFDVFKNTFDHLTGSINHLTFDNTFFQHSTDVTGAKSWGAELETQLLLARELGYLRAVDADRIFALHGEIERMLDRRQTLAVECHTVADGVRIVDCGVKAAGGVRDLEGLKQEYGSFKGWMTLNLRRTGKDQAEEQDRYSFEIFDPKHPPKIPRKCWTRSCRRLGFTLTGEA